MSPRTPLPIDESLPKIVAALQGCSFAVVEAEPGAGKTTRVPVALERAFGGQQPQRRQVIVTEPRRLAARLAASFVAQELGTTLGERIGYSVRFEDRSGPNTTLCYVTEGVLLRRLRRDPDLETTSVIVLDEFHERHLESDELLALLKRLCKRRRNLRLVVMSATLDSEPIARFLDNCPRFRCEGRNFPLDIRHDTELSDRPLATRVSYAVKRLLREDATGSVLVFLPGIAEIRKAERALSETRQQFGVDVLPLHGQLPLSEQAQATSSGARPRVVLATNVAESSVTVPDVTSVVDSGLVQQARDSLWTGQRQLELQPISQASARQRAGRAGRVSQGRVVRLYGEADLKHRPAFDVAELLRLELSSLLLDLSTLGLRPEDLEWLEPPPQSALDNARALLFELGAVNRALKLTAVGRWMSRVPLPARLSRVLHECGHLGIFDTGTIAMSLLAEQDIRLAHQQLDLPSAESDLQERLDRYREAEHFGFRRQELRAMDLDARRVDRVRQSVRQLQSFRPKDAPPAPGATACDAKASDALLRRALLVGFFDSVARRRAPRQKGSTQTEHAQQAREFVLRNGQSATALESSVVRHAPLVLALVTQQRGRGAPGVPPAGVCLRWLSAIDADWLFEDLPNAIEAQDMFDYNSEKRCVESVSRFCLGSLVLEESRLRAQPGPEPAKLLFEAARAQLAAIFGKRSHPETLIERIKLMRSITGCTAAGDDGPADAESLLRKACEHCVSLEELREVDFNGLILAQLSPEQQRWLERDVPQFVQLPSGRKLEVHYEAGKPPWIASRIQDFFGMSAGPSICQGQLPLTLHLLAPNGRAAQVTSDLPGFWDRHYSEIRKELRRRYARHFWPEDGRTARPPEPKRIKR